MWRELKQLAQAIRERGVSIIGAYQLDHGTVYLVYGYDLNAHERTVADHMVIEDVPVKHFDKGASFGGAPWVA